MTWINQQGLALYGAVTGTVALLISFFSYRHNVKKDQIKLDVSCAPHRDQAKNIEHLNTENPESPWDRPNLVEVYLVTVRNLGSIPAPLGDVGVCDGAGKKYQALVGRQLSQMRLLQPLSESNVESLEPRAARIFSVYLRRDEPMFTAVSAYAIDQTGKAWQVRA
ncbi:hypothetical protein ACW7G0_14190 [Lysobacter sp. A286]